MIASACDWGYNHQINVQVPSDHLLTENKQEAKCPVLTMKL